MIELFVFNYSIILYCYKKWIMNKTVIKLSLLSVLFVTSLACSGKRGVDKVKEGVEEVSEDVNDDLDEKSKESKGLKINFGK